MSHCKHIDLVRVLGVSNRSWAGLPGTICRDCGAGFHGHTRPDSRGFLPQIEMADYDYLIIVAPGARLEIVG